MKAFSVIGTSKTGKTTAIENIIRGLKKRNYSVGSIKEIHFDSFAIDTPGTNTDRHRQAGSELVTARGHHETDIMFPSKLPIEDILRYYDQDYVIMEGVKDHNIPKIACADKEDELEKIFDRSVFAVSGKIGARLDGFKGTPAMDPISEAERLVDLIEEKVFDVLPDFPATCCEECGFDCRELCCRILEGKSVRKDCIISNSNIKLIIDGREIDMVPFVQDILKGTLEGVIKNLEGYRKGKTIEIKIG
ncbi:MAG: molybdopterin-guanine dinucleotide biosynthesis protein B [Actinomycetia bacterium]|nr:molybdopterin-guanine dinucleotide biosynthesis protein B [Actinomycetes bacterium]